MIDIKHLSESFCKENNISITLSFEMPAGYETAYGTYDVTVNTLFLNLSVLDSAPEWEIIFYLFHELRHAMQYLRPELFNHEVRDSRLYVILYNGTCFKLVGTKWLECILEGDEDYFTEAYLSLPYELDANAYAYEKVKEICGDSPELRNLYNGWMPKNRWQYEEHIRLFHRIDAQLGTINKIS